MIRRRKQQRPAVVCVATQPRIGSVNVHAEICRPFIGIQDR